MKSAEYENLEKKLKVRRFGVSPLSDNGGWEWKRFASNRYDAMM